MPLLILFGLLVLAALRGARRTKRSAHHRRQQARIGNYLSLKCADAMFECGCRIDNGDPRPCPAHRAILEASE